MRKHNRSQKLSLHTQTVRPLSPAQLETAAGGTNSVSCPITYFTFYCNDSGSGSGGGGRWQTLDK